MALQDSYRPLSYDRCHAAHAHQRRGARTHALAHEPQCTSSVAAAAPTTAEEPSSERGARSGANDGASVAGSGCEGARNAWFERQAQAWASAGFIAPGQEVGASSEEDSSERSLAAEVDLHGEGVEGEEEDDDAQPRGQAEVAEGESADSDDASDDDAASSHTGRAQVEDSGAVHKVSTKEGRSQAHSSGHSPSGVERCGAAERVLREVGTHAKAMVSAPAAARGSASPRLTSKSGKVPPGPKVMRFPGVQVPVRIYWDADNINYTKRVYKAFHHLLGDVQVRSIEVFACGGAAAALCARNDGHTGATARPAGGVLHVDINADSNFKSKTDMRLATHALVTASHDPDSHFVIVSNDNDYLPLVCSLQTLGRRVVVVTLARRASSLTKAADGWIGLNTPKKTLAPAPIDSCKVGSILCASAQFEEYCHTLSECLLLCSGNIFSKLRARMLLEPSFCDHEGFPVDLVTCKHFKKSIALGFKGDKEWGIQQKIAVAELLIQYESEDLFAQLGFLVNEVPKGYANLFADDLKNVDPKVSTSKAFRAQGRAFLQTIADCS